MKIYVIGAYDRFKKCKGIKIGVSENIDARIKQLQTGNNDNLRLITYWDAKTPEAAYSAESDAHKKFEHHRMIGEWFYAKKLDKVMFWMSNRLNSGPAFIEGELCQFYIGLARARNKKSANHHHH